LVAVAARGGRRRRRRRMRMRKTDWTMSEHERADEDFARLDARFDAMTE